MANLIFHATAPFSLFCDDGVVARPFWTFERAEEMVANHPEHAFRIFERQADGSMKSIFSGRAAGEKITNTNPPAPKPTTPIPRRSR